MGQNVSVSFEAEESPPPFNYTFSKDRKTILKKTKTGELVSIGNVDNNISKRSTEKISSKRSIRYGEQIVTKRSFSFTSRSSDHEPEFFNPNKKEDKEDFDPTYGFGSPVVFRENKKERSFVRSLQIESQPSSSYAGGELVEDPPPVPRRGESLTISRYERGRLPMPLSNLFERKWI